MEPFILPNAQQRCFFFTFEIILHFKIKSLQFQSLKPNREVDIVEVYFGSSF